MHIYTSSDKKKVNQAAVHFCGKIKSTMGQNYLKDKWVLKLGIIFWLGVMVLFSSRSKIYYVFGWSLTGSYKYNLVSSQKDLVTALLSHSLWQCIHMSLISWQHNSDWYCREPARRGAILEFPSAQLYIITSGRNKAEINCSPPHELPVEPQSAVIRFEVVDGDPLWLESTVFIVHVVYSTSKEFSH